MRAMKDSGVEWIGEIPTDWRVSRVKNEFYSLDYKRIPVSAENRENKIGLYDYYGASGIIDKIDEYNVDEKVLLIGEDGANLRMRNLPLIYRADGKFWVNNHAHILKVHETNNYNFMAHLLEAGDYEEYITGTAQPKLSQANLMCFPICIPPIAEQTAIAAYLDDKCAKIDSIITVNERIIAKLKEYKASLITETVTKGLNPDAEMKDSDVEWIGEIPEAWGVVCLKYAGHFENGLTYSPNDITDGRGILVLRSSNIQSGQLNFADCVYVSKVPEALMVKNNDIIICSRNGSADLVGKCAYVDKDIVATFGAFMMRYRATIFNRFAFHVLQAAISYYKSLFTTSTINQLTIKTIRQMKIPLPPLAEQTAIAAYLDDKCSKIDNNIRLRESLIAKLAEYKKSLIYETVTGKKEIV